VTIHNQKASVPAAVAEPLAVVLAVDIAKAADLARQEKAQATRRAYLSDFEIFRGWCPGRGVCPLPATGDPPD
jgi:hypothetical protein